MAQSTAHLTLFGLRSRSQSHEIEPHVMSHEIRTEPGAPQDPLSISLSPFSSTHSLSFLNKEISKCTKWDQGVWGAAVLQCHRGMKLLDHRASYLQLHQIPPDFLLTRLYQFTSHDSSLYSEHESFVCCMCSKDFSQSVLSHLFSERKLINCSQMYQSFFFTVSTFSHLAWEISPHS